MMRTLWRGGMRADMADLSTPTPHLKKPVVR